MSTTWISELLIAGGEGVSVECVSSSNGTSLLLMVALFARKLPCIVANSHRMLTSTNAIRFD